MLLGYGGSVDSKRHARTALLCLGSLMHARWHARHKLQRLLRMLARFYTNILHAALIYYTNARK